MLEKKVRASRIACFMAVAVCRKRVVFLAQRQEKVEATCYNNKEVQHGEAGDL